MNNRLLISVAAAALLAGTGLANAQGAGGMGQGAGGMGQGGGSGAAQHSGPASGGGAAHTAPAQREDSGMKSGQSDRMGKEAEDKGGKTQQNTASDSDRTGKGGKDTKAEGRDKSTVGQAPDKSGGSSMQREDKGGSMSREGQKGDMNKGETGQKGATDTRNQGTMDNNRAQNPGGSQTTTGNAATSARVAAPPAEKQTQIVSAIKSEKITETNINVNVSVGTVLPASVRFVPLPPRIVEIYPEWRGYEVVLVKGRYVIVRPQTREIVYVIEG